MPVKGEKRILQQGWLKLDKLSVAFTCYIKSMHVLCYYAYSQYMKRTCSI